MATTLIFSSFWYTFSQVRYFVICCIFTNYHISEFSYMYYTILPIFHDCNMVHTAVTSGKFEMNPHMARRHTVWNTFSNHEKTMFFDILDIPLSRSRALLKVYGKLTGYRGYRIYPKAIGRLFVDREKEKSVVESGAFKTHLWKSGPRLSCI